MPQISFVLTVDNAPASPDLVAAVQQIEVEDHAEMADMMRLRIAIGGKNGCSGWNVLDDDALRRLSPISVGVTIGSGPTQTILTAYVTELNADLSNQPGQSMLNVVAMDATLLMTLEERVRRWPDMADSDIATAIFTDRAYGFTPVVDPTKYTRREEDETVMQRGHDIQFLKQLAARSGFECFVETNTRTGRIEGHFHKPRLDDPQGVLSVNLGEDTNVNTLSFRYDTTRPAAAAASGVDPETREHQPVLAERTRLTDLGRAPAGPDERRRRVLLGQTALLRSGELQTLAQATADRTAFAIVAEGDLNTVAYGSVLRAKRTVLVRGAGKTFNGTYYVDRVLHTLSGNGYRQAFSLKRNATQVTGRESFVPSRALSV
jgi:phage protein D